MSFLSSFDISAAGMSVEKVRADIASANLANMHTTRTAKGGPYQPMRAVVMTGAPGAASFESSMAAAGLAASRPQVTIQSADMAVRMVHEPEHPDANDKGFVAYPNINHLAEMVSLMEATRAYEANVSAFKSARSMALKALEIGGRS
ncbi:MAG: flagellar basal body rod protein FlgC [Burkholderiaceae bacterium]|nr:flagellar basal body rod protein FlgC [Burkholderiaceae bacterium]